MGTDSQMERRMTASGEKGKGVEGLNKKGKRTHGHGQQCDDCQGEGSIREQNGNGKIQ